MSVVPVMKMLIPTTAGHMIRTSLNQANLIPFNFKFVIRERNLSIILTGSTPWTVVDHRIEGITAHTNAKVETRVKQKIRTIEHRQHRDIGRKVRGERKNRQKIDRGRARARRDANRQRIAPRRAPQKTRESVAEALTLSVKLRSTLYCPRLRPKSIIRKMAQITRKNCMNQIVAMTTHHTFQHQQQIIHQQQT